MTPLSPAGDTPGCLSIAGVFALLMVPLYLLFRLFVKLVRQAYGFDRPDDADLPPLRVCFACNNTVLEDDFAHCPYCGAALPRTEDEAEDEAVEAATDEAGDAAGG